MGALLRTAGNAVIRVFLSPSCAACDATLDRPLDHPVCPTCWQSIEPLAPPLCGWCGDSLTLSQAVFGVCQRCLAAPPAFEQAVSAGRHAGSLKRLIHAFKYEGRRTLAAPLAALLLERASQQLAQVDLVVPVPLHPLRAMARGFNQAEDLARYLGKPVYRLLRRRRHGVPQARLAAEERQQNVAGAFARRFALAGSSRDLERIRHRSIALVDDVMTTGATMNACSRVLMEAGARSVLALSVARAVAREPPRSPQSPHLSKLPRR